MGDLQPCPMPHTLANLYSHAKYLLNALTVSSFKNLPHDTLSTKGTFLP